MSVGVTVSGGTSVSVSIGGGIGPQGAAGAGGVTKLNTYTGAITLVGAGGASVSGVTAAGGATITITAGSGGGGGGGLVDSVNGLTGTVVLSSVSVSAASAVHTHNAVDITAGVFDRNRLPFATTKAVGAVQASTGLAVNAEGHLSADVQSVAGRTGAVTLSTTDVALFSSAAGAAAPVQSVQGKTGAVLLSVADITAAASVHTHSTTDVALFTAAAAAASPVQSVQGLTGALTLVVTGGTVTTSGSTITLAVSAATVDWSSITGKPATFTPAVHGHVIADVTGLQTALDGKQKTITISSSAPTGGSDGDIWLRYT